MELNRIPPTWDLLPVVLSLLVGKLQTIDLVVETAASVLTTGTGPTMGTGYDSAT